MTDYRTTVEKVLACRNKHAIGVDEAKRIVLRDELRLEIERAENVEDIKNILRQAFPALDHSGDY